MSPLTKQTYFNLLIALQGGGRREETSQLKMVQPEDPDELVQTSGALPKRGHGREPLQRTLEELEDRSKQQLTRAARRAPGGDHPQKIRTIVPEIDEQIREVEGLKAIRVGGGGDHS